MSVRAWRGLLESALGEAANPFVSPPEAGGRHRGGIALAAMNMNITTQADLRTVVVMVFLPGSISPAMRGSNSLASAHTTKGQPEDA